MLLQPRYVSLQAWHFENPPTWLHHQTIDRVCFQPHSFITPCFLFTLPISLSVSMYIYTHSLLPAGQILQTNTRSSNAHVPAWHEIRILSNPSKSLREFNRLALFGVPYLFPSCAWRIILLFVRNYPEYGSITAGKWAFHNYSTYSLFRVTPQIAISNTRGYSWLSELAANWIVW